MNNSLSYNLLQQVNDTLSSDLSVLSLTSSTHVTATDLIATNVNVTNVTGTLQTAAQANVTSVGTLTTLNMGGFIDLNGSNINDVNTITTTYITAPLSTDLSLGGSALYSLRVNDTEIIADNGLNMNNNPVTSASAVGVQTTNPNYEMQINSSDGPNSFLQFTGTTSGTTAADGLLIGLDSSNEVRIQNRESTGMHFYTSDNVRMILDANGNLKLGTGTITPSTKLELVSTNGAFLPPKMTTTQRNSLAGTAGHVVYNTTDNKLQCYNGTIWNDLF